MKVAFAIFCGAGKVLLCNSEISGGEEEQVWDLKNRDLSKDKSQSPWTTGITITSAALESWLLYLFILRMNPVLQQLTCALEGHMKAALSLHLHI